jgi:hypothetical protein
MSQNLNDQIEFYEDQQILYFKVTGVSQAAIDSWFDFLEARLVAWPADKPYLVLYDVTHPSVSLTPYMQKKAKQLNHLRPDVSGRIAILSQASIIAHMFQFFARMLVKNSRPARIFFKEEDALNWLREAV